MKKLGSFAGLFVVHFAVSLILNWVFGESEHIGRTLITSLLFVISYSVLLYLIGKTKRKN